MGTWLSFWSERAERAEQDADRMALLLSRILERQHLPFREYQDTHDVLRDWRVNREARYRAHPAGPTLAGNLSSGGVTS